jgi:GNAT acetyltransferase-like protein
MLLETFGIPGQRSARFAILREFPSPELEKAWKECLERVELPSHYNAPEYFLSPLWAGKRPFAVLALDGSRVVGVLTGVHEGEQLNCGQISRPQICIDRMAEPADVERALVEGLLAEAGSEPLLSVYSWALLDSFQQLGFRHRQLEGDVVLDLTLGPEALFRQFHASRRKNIRAAIRHGVEVSEAYAKEDLLEYYDVYLKWRETERKKIVGELLSLDSFMTGRALTANSRLFVARYAGKIIAGIIVRFFRGGLLEFAGHSSLDEFLHLKPNDLLQWRVIEWACQEGFPRACLGGAHTFHARFGGTLVPIHRYRIDRTWIRWHDLREAVLDFGRDNVRRMPVPVERAVRRLLGKT